MSAVDTGSLYFDAVPLPLRDLMWRIGASVRPAQFVEAVVEAWREVEVVSEEAVQERFRSSRAYRDLRDAIRRAAGPSARVLAIGSGPGLNGRSSSYAASVVREILPPAGIARLDRLDLTPSLLEDAGGPYHLIVTHSLLHFVYDFRPICRLIRSLVAAGGAYVMANEPNARFWANSECVREMKQVAAAESRLKRLRKFASPARYWRRIRRLGSPERSWCDEMNAILRRRFGLTGALTPKEIMRIIDPYVPDPYPGDCAIGADGIDWSGLESGAMLGMRIEHVATSGYVMRSNPATVPGRWRALDEKLAAQYPLDGCSFTAVWRKTG